MVVRAQAVKKLGKGARADASTNLSAKAKKSNAHPARRRVRRGASAVTFADLDAVLKAARGTKHSAKHSRHSQGASTASRLNVPRRPLGGEPCEAPDHHASPLVEHLVETSPIKEKRCPRSGPVRRDSLVRAFHCIVSAAKVSEADMVVSFTLVNGMWGTYFAEDHTCLQFIPLPSTVDSTAHDSTVGCAVGFLLAYINPSGHCFVLPPEKHVASPRSFLDSDVHVVQHDSFPQLPCCLLNKLLCAIKTRVLSSPVESDEDGVVLGRFSEVRGTGDDAVCVTLSCALPLHEVFDPSCRNATYSPSSTVIDPSEASRLSPAVKVTVPGERCDSVLLVSQVQEMTREGPPPPPHDITGSISVAAVRGVEVDRLSVPHVTAAVCMWEDHRPTSASTAFIPRRCQLTLGTRLTPYPDNVFYRHPDEKE